MDLCINRHAPSYAYTPLSRGSEYSQSAWVFYILGRDAQPTGSAGQMFVSCGRGVSLSGISAPLEVGKTYHIRWAWTSTGGVLSVDGVVQMQPVPICVYDNSTAPAAGPLPLVTYSVIYTGSGRYHSKFDGTISNIVVRGIL